jgi:hypothetical protein
MRGIIACSEVDRNLLAPLSPRVPVFVVPNVVDTDHYVPADTPPDPCTVLFQGGVEWYPNRDAVEFFARKILPEIRRRVPGVIFRVAGRSPSDAFRRPPVMSTTLGAEGLEFRDTEEIVLAGDPGRFAASVASLLWNGIRRNSLGKAAQLRVETQYALASLQAALRATIAEVLR